MLDRFHNDVNATGLAALLLVGCASATRDAGLQGARASSSGEAARLVYHWAGSVLKANWLRGLVSADTSDSLHFWPIVRRVGLPLLAGTDVFDGMRTCLTRAATEHRERLPAFPLHAELAIYVVEGLTPVEAAQAATLNPAKMLHGTDSLATVAPGRLADLVLLDADPLADITNTTTIRAVVANGRYFDRAALDQLLTDVRAEAGQRP